MHKIFLFIFAFQNSNQDFNALCFIFVTNLHLKLLDRALNNIRSFLPDIMINIEKYRLFVKLCKVLHNVDHLFHCKLPQFVKPINITKHIAQQKDRAFVLARYKNSLIPWNIHGIKFKFY